MWLVIVERIILPPIDQSNIFSSACRALVAGGPTPEGRAADRLDDGGGQNGGRRHRRAGSICSTRPALAEVGLHRPLRTEVRNMVYRTSNEMPIWTRPRG